MRPFFVYAQLLRLPNTFTAMADILLGALATGWLGNRWLAFLQLAGLEKIRVWSEEIGVGVIAPSSFGGLDRTSAQLTIAGELRTVGTFLCLLFASTLLYWSGMIWNDYFDINQDRKERPGRPLASGRIALRTAWLLGGGCMMGGVALALLADFLQEPGRWRSTPFVLALVVAIFLYDGLFKKTWAGPVLMGTCRALNLLLGFTILGAWPPAWAWLLALVIGLYISGVTWYASTEAQLSNQPMLIGAGVVILSSLVLALTVPAVALETSTNFQPSMLFPYLLFCLGVYLGQAVLRGIRDPQPSCVQPAVKRAILGLVLLDALLASAFVGTAGLLLALLLIPGMVLGRWLYST